jgi:hypothetical protein
VTICWRRWTQSNARSVHDVPSTLVIR